MQDEQILILICYSARPLLGHHALVSMVGFRIAGFMLSGSGIRVFVLGNVGLGWGGWGKVQATDGEGGGVVGMWVVGKYSSLFHLAIVRGKKLYL